MKIHNEDIAVWDMSKEAVVEMVEVKTVTYQCARCGQPIVVLMDTMSRDGDRAVEDVVRELKDRYQAMVDYVNDIVGYDVERYMISERMKQMKHEIDQMRRPKLVITDKESEGGKSAKTKPDKQK